MSYYVGDIPAAPLVIEPARGGDPLDISDYTVASISLIDPTGIPVEAQPTATIVDDEGITVIRVTWGNASPFAASGVHVARITVSDDAGHKLRMPAVRLAVDTDDGWYTVDDARDDWLQGPVSDVRLYELLQVAKKEVIDFAPDLPDGASVPLSYRQAQLDHARDVWNASKVDPSTGDDGDDSFAVRAFPLDWTIKQRLRPQHPGRPTVAGLPEGYVY
ncbi:hypothetical protein [Gryllotalpicola koreensis]|uniref:Uncharacterized protein n=1 Tax=Gryllotalpicola koreensis TaxID=993086 RepID=A0ABP7ZUK7_9MICO